MLIAVTPSIREDEHTLVLNETYLKAIAACGGTPVILPLLQDAGSLREIADRFDGFLFSGGGDIDPCYFGEDVIPECGSISPERDAAELALAKLLLAEKKPVLGICRGEQVLNVALGGSLYQDINSQQSGTLAHRQKQPFGYPSHKVSVKRGTLLYSILRQDEIPVNSMHHQAVFRKADPLIISATAPDGIPEAIELPGHPFWLGVQWHPERLWQEHAQHTALFQAFVRACGQV